MRRRNQDTTITELVRGAIGIAIGAIALAVILAHIPQQPAPKAQQPVECNQ